MNTFKILNDMISMFFLTCERIVQMCFRIHREKVFAVFC